MHGRIGQDSYPYLLGRTENWSVEADFEAPGGDAGEVPGHAKEDLYHGEKFVTLRDQSTTSRNRTDDRPISCGRIGVRLSQMTHDSKW